MQLKLNLALAEVVSKRRRFDVLARPGILVYLVHKRCSRFATELGSLSCLTKSAEFHFYNTIHIFSHCSFVIARSGTIFVKWNSVIFAGHVIRVQFDLRCSRPFVLRDHLGAVILDLCYCYISTGAWCWWYFKYYGVSKVEVTYNFWSLCHS